MIETRKDVFSWVYECGLGPLIVIKQVRERQFIVKLLEYLDFQSLSDLDLKRGYASLDVSYFNTIRRCTPEDYDQMDMMEIVKIYLSLE